MRVAYFFLLLFPFVTGDYCGEGRLPIGFEVSPAGKVHLTCEKPDCMDREFSDCPERADSVSCPGESTWVGGLNQRVDGTIRLRCCQYPKLGEYAEQVFNNITMLPGTYFESAVKFVDGSKKDMEWFDLISNVKQTKTSRGVLYTLTIHRFNCSKLGEDPPAWWNENSWPFWSLE